MHVAVIEVDPETGVYEVVDYAAVDDCGTRIHPQIVEGQVMGATAHGLGAATHERFAYDEDGNLLTPNFYDYHVPHALDMPPLKAATSSRRRRSRRSGRRAWARAAAPRSTRSAPRCRTRCKVAGGAIVTDSCNPYHRVWECCATRREPRRREVVRRVNVRASARSRAAGGRLGGAERSGAMAATMPGVQSFEVRTTHWTREREDPARPRRRSRCRRLREDRGARDRVARAARSKGNGVGAMMNMQTPLRPRARRTAAAR